MGCNAKITGCTATNGGAVYLASDGTIDMDGGEITGNTASSDGGGIYLESGTLDISSGTISTNIATKGNGGGIYFGNSGNAKVTSAGGTISGNHAGANGGGIYFAGEANIDHSAGIIIGNSADASGGGLYITSGTLVMNGTDDGAICNNKAASSGDDIVTLKATLVSLPDAEHMGSLGYKYNYEGREFKIAGWYYDNSGARFNFTHDKEISATSNLSGALALVAATEGTIITITYNGNAEGVSDVPASEQRLYVAGENSTFSVSDTRPSRTDDYKFTNWSTVASPSSADPGTTYLPGADIPLTGVNITLYAQWEAVNAPADAAYIISIPPTITVTDNGGENMHITTKTSNFGSGNSLTVSVSSANNFQLKLSSDSSQSIRYSIKNGSSEGSSVTGGEQVVNHTGDGEYTDTLYLEVDSGSSPQYAGNYTDTLTFTITFS